MTFPYSGSSTPYLPLPPRPARLHYHERTEEKDKPQQRREEKHTKWVKTRETERNTTNCLYVVFHSLLSDLGVHRSRRVFRRTYRLRHRVIPSQLFHATIRRGIESNPTGSDEDQSLQQEIRVALDTHSRVDVTMAFRMNTVGRGGRMWLVSCVSSCTRQRACR